MKKINSKGFTLIELLVVIAIIGLLSTLAVVALNNARAKSRDAKRVADVKQIQTAMEIYYNECSGYPTALTIAAVYGACTTPFGAFMAQIPTAPTPADTPCVDATNTYTYTQDAAGASYSIDYCLGSQTGSIPNNVHTATPAGMTNP